MYLTRKTTPRSVSPGISSQAFGGKLLWLRSIAANQHLPNTGYGQNSKHQAWKKDQGEVNPPMRRRQQTSENFDGVTECVGCHKKGDHEEYGTTGIQAQCAPVKREAKNEVSKADITD